MSEEQKKPEINAAAAQTFRDYCRDFYTLHPDDCPPFIAVTTDGTETHCVAGGSVQDFCELLYHASRVSSQFQQALMLAARRVAFEAMQEKAREEAVKEGIIDAEGNLTDKGRAQADKLAETLKGVVAEMVKGEGAAANEEAPVDEPEVAAAKAAKEGGQ